MPLNERIIRGVQPRTKPFKLSDGKGLYLLVQPNGSRWWRMRYRFEGKDRMLSVGTYPSVSLDQARAHHTDMLSTLADCMDPSAKRKADKSARAATFELVAREWWDRRRHFWKGKYCGVILNRFQRYIFPYVGSRAVRHIHAADFLDCFERMERQGVLETAHKMRSKCSQVMRYAVATRRADRDPLVDLRGALTPVKRRHYPSITAPSAVGGLLRAIDGYHGKSQIVRCALKLLPLVFVRSSELRYAQWEEFDLEAATWKIPAERMKRPLPHLVPLSRQALKVLRQLQEHSGPDGYVFPGVRSTARPISENTVNAALRNMGYTKDQMTGHGFRSMACTLLNEQGWNADAIERQLAHVEKSDIRAAYNYAQYLPERRRMMQAWADHLDRLRAKPPDAENRSESSCFDETEETESSSSRRLRVLVY